MKHLTIDLDFYAQISFADNPLRFKALLDTLYRIEKTNVDVIMKTHHHHILSYINQYKFTEIINVDAHSDIVNETGVYVLECGTWANFYKYKNDCIFTWIHPHSDKGDVWVGRCDDAPLVDWHKVKDTFGFKDAKYRHKSVFKPISIPKDIHSISVVLSPEYWNHKNEEYIETIKKLFPWLRNNYKRLKNEETISRCR